MGSSSPPTRGSRRILAALALTNLVAYAARNALFTVYPDLHARFHIDDAQIGLLQTFFMLPHAAATLPFGWAGDHFDRRKVIAAGMLLASIAGAAGALGTSYAGLAASRACVGLGTAAVAPVATSILAQIFEGPRKASRLSIFNLGLLLGGVVGFVSGVVLGFPVVVVVLAIPGVLLAIWVVALPVPGGPRGQAAPAAAAVPEARVVQVDGEPVEAGARWWRFLGRLTTRFVRDSRMLLGIRTLRRVIVSTTLMAFCAGGYNAWLKEFLTREKKMTDGEAAMLLSLALVGGLIGIIVGGRVGDWLRGRLTNGRLWTIAIGMSLAVPCAILAIELPPGAGLYVSGIGTLFFFSWYHAPMAASVDDLAPAGVSVAAQGLVIFMMHMIGTAPSSWVVGVVSERTNLTTAMWVPTFALIGAALAMALATTRFAADHAWARRRE